MTTRYEQRCLTLLRAYPPRYRAARGDELLGTLLDAATPGRTTPSVRESWDVIRGGLATRWHAHPPAWRWLLYRGYGARLPYAHRWWARDDIRGRWFYLRDNFGHILLAGPLYVGMVTASSALISLSDGTPYRSPLPSGDGWWWVLIFLTALTLIPIPGLSGRKKRLTLKKHEFFPDGTPFEAALMWGPARPLQAPPGVPTAPPPPVAPAAAVPGSWPRLGHVPASWPPMVPPVAARTQRPQPPDDGASPTAGPWPPPE